MASECQTLTIRQPDDWHHHLRDGAVLADTAFAASRQFARAIVMPNLTPPVTNAAAATAYKGRILEALHSRGVPAGSFDPLMALYLTDSTTEEDIKAAVACGDVKAVKLYPAGATTNSDNGVTDYAKIRGAVAAMAHHGLPLCVHGEVTDPSVDIFDRERVFVRENLPQLLGIDPKLKVVLEHLSTREAVDAVLGSGGNVAGTVTPQHLLVNRNAMLVRCYATLRYATLCCAVLCCAVMCCAVLCCAMPCHDMTCHAMLMPCYAVLCWRAAAAPVLHAHSQDRGR
jgi:dihydroorotase